MEQFDLKQFRQDKNLTQKDLADLFNCNQVFISRIEKGERQIPKDKLVILQSKYGNITNYYKECTEAISVPEASTQDILLSGADAFSRQIVQMMNEKLIAPYQLVEEKEKEIERLNRLIGKLQAELEASKKIAAQGNAECADAV